MPTSTVAQYSALLSIGVGCVVHKLRKPISPHFWMNINDPRFEVPGIVEFSRLRDVGAAHIVCVPYYMPQTHEKFGWTDQQLITETTNYLRTLNPQLSPDGFLAQQVGGLRYAQPVCGPRFLETLPPICPGIRGLQVADTSYDYPEDRGVSEGVRLARQMAAAV